MSSHELVRFSSFGRIGQKECVVGESSMENGVVPREIDTRGIITKTKLPVGDYVVNPYVECTHGCRYCYASFMKRFTNHKEEWGSFLDVKYWPDFNPEKYEGNELFFGSVTCLHCLAMHRRAVD